MSFREKLEKYRKKPDPFETMVKSIFDPDINSPDIFYKKDDLDGMTILRKYDKSSGKPVYRGTYEVLLTEERYEMQCIALRRVANEDVVLEDSRDDWNKVILARYEPIYGGRIVLHELPEATGKWMMEQLGKRR